jgi:ABC-type phosphate transport system substrate-binding protein
MKLSEIVDSSLQKLRVVQTFFSYPGQVITQFVERRGEDAYNKIKIPWWGKKHKNNSANNDGIINHFDDGLETNTQTTAISQNQTISGILPVGHTLKSDGWDNYIIQSSFDKQDGICFYSATNKNQELVVIKEYNLQEIGCDRKIIPKRQEAFKNLVKWNLKIANGQDFRLVQLIDAINKDNNCYLVTKPISDGISLEKYLSNYGRMTAKQIREVIKQVLGTLEFLGTYRMRFSDAKLEERGIVHGNINLRSLILKKTNFSSIDERQFFIYLSDLALWEHLFYAPDSERYKPNIAKTREELGSVEDDLKKLGLVSFCLAGGSTDKNFTEALNFESPEIWSQLQDDQLKGYIQRLLGFERPFSNASDASNHLISLPLLNIHKLPEQPLTDIENNQSSKSENLEETSNQFNLTFVWSSLFVISSALLYILYYTFPKKNPDTFNKHNNEETVKNTCCESITRNFQYIPGTEWNFVTENLLVNPNPDKFQTKVNFFNVLSERTSGSIITSIYPPNRIPNISRDYVFTKLNQNQNQREQKPDFALMRLENKLNVQGLTQVPLAYDAIVIIVAFRVNTEKNQNLIQKLNGQIKLDQLIDIYNGKLTELDNIKIQPLLPDRETVNIFKKLVSDKKPIDFKGTNDKKNYEINELYKKILDESSNEKVLISFSRLSRMFGNCSVYPLAVAEDNRAIQVLVDNDNKEIQPNNIDLCNDKGSYKPNEKALNENTYPLTYKLGIVFRKDNSYVESQVVKALQTPYSKSLLRQLGYVPAEGNNNDTNK